MQNKNCIHFECSSNILCLKGEEKHNYTNYIRVFNPSF